MLLVEILMKLLEAIALAIGHLERLALLLLSVVLTSACGWF